MKKQSAYNLQHRRDKRWFVLVHKAERGCEKCGERHPACLSFHHMDGDTKEANIASLIGRGASWRRLLAEMSKCIVLCENCHRKLHWEIGDQLASVCGPIPDVG